MSIIAPPQFKKKEEEEPKITILVERRKAELLLGLLDEQLNSLNYRQAAINEFGVKPHAAVISMWRDHQRALEHICDAIMQGLVKEGE